MKEAEFFTRFVRPKLKAWGTYDRIENGLSGGIPDINYVVDKSHGWLETKIIHAGKVYFERFQLPWLSRRSKYMEKGLWVIATDTKQLYLWKPSTLLLAPRTTYQKWTVLQVSDLSSSIEAKDPWAWDQVRLQLAQF